MSFSKEAAFDLLRAAHSSGRLAHANLFTGPIGCGKSWLALRLAGLALDCPPDKVLAHPDTHIVQPESKSRRIVIAQIRELEQSVRRKPLVAGTKVALIYDADRMLPQAANAFLKTLEEPPSGSLLLLLSTLPEAMLETVLSRCIETSLHGTAAREASPEEAVLIEALGEALLRPLKPGTGEAFRFTRIVRDMLATLRKKVTAEHDQLLKADVAHYQKTSDADAWLRDREGQMKALSEAAVLRERERILQIITDVLGTALRVQHGYPSPHATIKSLAEKFPVPDLLRRLDALETLRRRLSLGVQEALALESSFLEMIITQKA
jgi:DNA polymerase III subunit delta'